MINRILGMWNEVSDLDKSNLRKKLRKKDNNFQYPITTRLKYFFHK